MNWNKTFATPVGRRRYQLTAKPKKVDKCNILNYVQPWIFRKNNFARRISPSLNQALILIESQTSAAHRNNRLKKGFNLSLFKNPNGMSSLSQYILGVQL